MTRCLMITVPMHLSGLWIPVYGETPETTGSLGAGLCLRPRITIRACRSDTPRLVVNGEELRGVCVADHLSRRLGALSVLVETPAPLGAGLGVSAAVALGYAVAASILYGHTSILEDAAAYAHEAELQCRTGLGDVIAEYYGGFEIRVKPGPPGHGVVKHVYVGGPGRIYLVVLGTGMDTPSMLRSITRETYSYARILLDKLLENPGINEFFAYAERFTRRIFDYGYADKLLTGIKRCVAGYFVKKNILAIMPRRGKEDAVETLLREHGLSFITAQIDNSGIGLGGGSLDER